MGLLNWFQQQLSGNSLTKENSVSVNLPVKEKVPAYAFISYAHKDAGVVTQLAAFLEREEIPPWKDNRLEYGESWEDDILSRLHGCEVFLIVMSSSSLNSAYVNKELDLAIKEKKKILPILIGGEPFERLKHLQHLQLLHTDDPKTRFTERLRDLLTPQIIPSIAVQQRRVEYFLLKIFEVVCDKSLGVRATLGIGFEQVFGVDLEEPLDGLDELDWAEVFITLHNALPSHNFGHDLKKNYSLLFPTIRDFSNHLLNTLTWNEIRQL